MTTPQQPKVSVGLATITGYITAVLGICSTAVVAISGSEAQLHGPGKWTAILGVVALVVTNLGRQLQAHGLIKASLAERVDSVSSTVGLLSGSPTLEQELASQPPGAEVPPAVLQSVPAPGSPQSPPPAS